MGIELIQGFYTSRSVIRIFTPYCLLGTGSKISLIVDIIHSVNDGQKSLLDIVEDLSKRPMILGSDIESIVPLARKFGFIEGEDPDLRITKEGLEFMKYVDSTSRETSELASPMEENYRTLDETLKEIGEKYKKEDKKVFDDIQEIRRLTSKHISNAPEAASDYEWKLTATMPQGLGQAIPLQLSGSVIHHDEAIRKVIKDARRELYISSPYIEPDTFRMLVGNCFTAKISCKLITSDEDRLVDKPYKLEQLKSFTARSFLDTKIRFLKRENVIAHAKVWLSEKSVHITSANILTNSQVENFELGIYSSNPSLVNACQILVDKVWEHGVKI